MTSLSTHSRPSRPPAPPTPTVRSRTGPHDRATAGGGVPDPAQRPAHGRGAGPGLHRPGARRRRRARRGVPRRAALPARGPALGGAGPVPAVDRPLRHRAVRGAGRGRDHPGRGAGDLRLRRVAGCRCRAWRPTRPAWRSPAARWATASTVATGMALGLRHQGNPARVYNLLSDGELDEGSTWEAALQIAPPRPGQRHRDRRRQRPAGRRPHRGHPAHRAGRRQVAGVRLARPAGGRQRHRRAGRRLRRAARATRARRRC